jgi:hypothetical protein
MIKKIQFPIFAAILLTGSLAFGQSFTILSPSDLGRSASSEPVNEIFDISGQFSLPSNSVTLAVSNGFVTESDTWTVSEFESTTFILGGTEPVLAFVNHGANLGSENFQNGSLSRDGVTSAPGETWALISALDNDYSFGVDGDDYFVDYVGEETEQLESNSSGFQFASNEAASSFTVFSSNTTALNNNFNVGFALVNAIPEPTSGVVLACMGLVFLRRNRN